MWGETREGEREMKPLLDFDDAGASDDEPVKGVTVGDIRAWHNEIENLKASYDKILDSWAECRFLLAQERQEGAKWREDYAMKSMGWFCRLVSWGELIS